VSSARATSGDLASIPLFVSLAPAERARLAQRFTVRHYPRDALVAVAGDRLQAFHFILSGRIQWFWRDEADHQLKLGIEEPGSHFADVTLGGEPVLMSVVALEDVRVISIPMAEFHEVLLRHPEVARALLLDVVARLRRVLQATRSLTMEDVYARVVKLVLSRAVTVDGKRVAELTHAEIGHRVGATREMVGKLLRDLAKGGYIEAERGRVTLLRDLPKRW
jgi:CRP/FNR family cyclic AMP-dependent transcriptional regulator